MGKRHAEALLVALEAVLRALIARLLSNGTLDRPQVEDLLHRAERDLSDQGGDLTIAREVLDTLRAALIYDDRRR